MSRAARKSSTPSRRARPTITDLYTRFARADAVQIATPSSTKGKLSNPAFDRAVRKALDAASQVTMAPALSIDEMLLKIRVAIWVMGGTRYKKLEDLDNLKPGPHDAIEGCALLTLRDDLKRLQSSTNRRRAV